MKKFFITGLSLILPLTITIAIAVFLINFLTDPFVGSMARLLVHFGIFSQMSNVVWLTSKILTLLLLFFFTLGLGFIGQKFLTEKLISMTDIIFTRLPIINKIYNPSKELIHRLFAPQSNSFKEVVSIHYPNKKALTLALIAQNQLATGSSEQLKDRSIVLVLSSLNPTMGLVLFYKKNEIEPINMKSEDAMKYVISAGILPSPIIRLKEQTL